ncbi:hypothetical protein IFM89_000236, partial [Coptis chinensis]
QSDYSSIEFSVSKVIGYRFEKKHSSDLLMRLQIFTFADTYRGSYSVSIPEVQTYCNSTGYGDETVGASCLYHATRGKFMSQVSIGENGKEFANTGAIQHGLVGIASIFGTQKNGEALMCTFYQIPLASARMSGGGMIWVNQWNALQHTVGSAFLAVLYSDYMLSSQTAALYCNGKTYTYANL